MSTKPNPVALTAAMLATRYCSAGSRSSLGDWILDGSDAHVPAFLASRLHRLSRGAARASLAECNGEMYDGQRDKAYAAPRCIRLTLLQEIDGAVARFCARINRAIAKLNADLSPLAIEARRNGDPRGFAIKLRSTDPTRPLPSNETGGEWGI